MRLYSSMMVLIHSFWITLLVGLPLAVSSVQAQGDVPLTVRLQAPTHAMIGEAIPLTLQVSGGRDAIGGMETLTLFDTTVAEFASFYPSLTASSVDAQPGLGTLVAPDTAVGAAVGFFTCATPECQEVGVALAEMATAGIAAVAPDLLATVEVIPLVAGQLEIRLGNLQLVDHAGHILPVALEQATVTIQIGEGGEAHPAPATPWDVAAAHAASAFAVAAADVTGDQTISYADVMETALGWQIVHEQLAACAGAEPSADLNQDGCVTVADVQLAAANVGAPVPSDPKQLPNQLYMPSLHSDVNGDINSGINNAPALSDAEGAIDGPESEERAEAAAAMTFVVNSVGDQVDVNIGNGVCLTAQGTCTLRAAIAEANRHAGQDSIYFSIPGGGIKTIQLGSRLPTLSGGSTIINGYTQPGSHVNTNAQASNAVILIQIRGQAEAFDGISITSANNRVRGIAFFNLRRSLWIYGAGANNNLIIGNFVGTDATSTFESPISTQQGQGIKIEQGAQQNRVGGTTAAERNVISGNQLQGIGIWHWPTRFNLVYNNLVGLSADGTRRLGNRTHGIDVNFGAADNNIGGTDPGQRNVVSGNGNQGIEVSHTGTTANNQVIGNFVGTDVTGNGAADYTKNGGYGIQLKDRVRNNRVAHNVVANNAQAGISLDNFGTCCLVGNVIENNLIGVGLNGAALGNHGKGMRVQGPGSRIGPGNIIAYNPDGGILIGGDTNDGNTITQNSIFSNSGLGIDIAPIFSVNANDAGDTDSGPNEQLNFPVIQSATPIAVTGVACGGCRVEIFIATGQSGAHGQGRTFVGAATADSAGNFSVATTGVIVGNNVTSTATDSAGNTSEFSANVSVQ